MNRDVAFLRPREPIGLRSLAEQVHELLCDRLLSGAIAAGEPIRQDALAAEFGISKIPLREALARLEQGGLVRLQAHRGYVAAALSEAEAEEVLALRLQIEPEATVRASRMAGPADHEAAETALAALEASIRAGTDVQGRLNRLFHMALVRPGAGRLTLGILERLHMLGERYTRLHLLQHGRDSRVIAGHRRLLDLWTLCAAEPLEALAGQHIRDTIVDLRAQLAHADPAPP